MTLLIKTAPLFVYESYFKMTNMTTQFEHRYNTCKSRKVLKKTSNIQQSIIKIISPANIFCTSSSMHLINVIGVIHFSIPKKISNITAKIIIFIYKYQKVRMKSLMYFFFYNYCTMIFFKIYLKQ